MTIPRHVQAVKEANQEIAIEKITRYLKTNPGWTSTADLSKHCGIKASDIHNAMRKVDVQRKNLQAGGCKPILHWSLNANSPEPVIALARQYQQHGIFAQLHWSAT